MQIVDPGHDYIIEQALDSSITQQITFLKRSGKIIKHENEHDGIISQQLLRVLIDRTKYLYDVLPCEETADTLYYLRMAMYCYEVRAYRRKQAKVNRQDLDHLGDARPTADRTSQKDIPFSYENIENLPIGDDGHIVLI